jgi:DNA polymerase, archaea type
MNSLLYGHNPKQHVVAVHQLNDRFIRLYTRTNGKIQHEDVEFFPFFFISDPTLLEDFPKQFWLKELSGDLFYKHIAAFSRWGEMWEAIHFALNAYNKHAPSKVTHYHEIESILLRPDPVNQFLSQSGNTLFKGMEFDELHRMQIDVQRVRPFPAVESKAANPQFDRIVLSDTTGWYDSIESEHTNQEEMLRSLISIIQQRDPDVLEGHNLYGQTLPNLVSLAGQFSVDFSIGRDGSSLKHISPRQPYRIVEGEAGYYEVAGRHLVDTQRLAEIFDASSRSFESFNLDYLARYFGLDSESSSEPPIVSEPAGARIRTRKPKDPPIENVKRVRRLSEVLSLSNFYLAQMCPLNFGALLRTGSAAKIESLMFREYLRRKHSLPNAERGSSSRGGYTDIFYSGVFSNILHADVEALYPSIIISQKIKPKSDRLGIFVPILTELTEMRLDAKLAVQQATTPQLQSRYDALQSAIKVLINSFYGYLAYARAHFNDYEQANHITAIGQTYLRTIIDQAHLFNAKVLEVDTDGLFFIPPDNVAGENEESLFVNRLASSLPTGINLLLAGRYKKMLSYKKKNYALQDYSDKIIIKGSSLVSRSLELFARRYIEKCVEYLLLGDFENLHRTYTSQYRRILAHQWSAREFCKSETVNDDLESYERDLKTGSHTPSPAMEAAKRASLYPRIGLVIPYYITGTEANVRIAANCRIAEEWDSNLPDENTPYYLSRLDECSAKFKDLFTPGDFEKIFSTDDLFGFSPTEVSLITRELQPQKPDLQAEDTDDEFPIWLGDLPS